MSERRRETRKKIIAFAPVRDASRGILLGYLGDLNMLGIQVIGERPLEPNIQMNLSIQLPDDLPGISVTRMTIAARVARCVPDEDNPHEYHIGFAFLEVQPEQAKIIKAVLQRYFFRYQSEE